MEGSCKHQSQWPSSPSTACRSLQAPGKTLLAAHCHANMICKKTGWLEGEGWAREPGEWVAPQSLQVACKRLRSPVCPSSEHRRAKQAAGTTRLASEKAAVTEYEYTSQPNSSALRAQTGAVQPHRTFTTETNMNPENDDRTCHAL